MGEWTWLHKRFPLADIHLTQPPMQAADANVLIRLVRQVSNNGERCFQVRVSPHGVAPFRGGPWIHTFTGKELDNPEEELEAFRVALAAQVERAKKQTRPSRVKGSSDGT